MLYTIIWNALIYIPIVYNFFWNHPFHYIWIVILPSIFEIVYIYANLLFPLVQLVLDPAFYSAYSLNTVLLEVFAFLPVTLQLCTFWYYLIYHP